MLNQNPANPGHPTCPAREAAFQGASTMSLAERRARALAPTIFCPASKVEHCIRQATPSSASS